MSSSIYSNELVKVDSDPQLSKHVLSLLSEAAVDNINTRLTFAEHGFYVFIQYKEIKYIVNGYPEEVFWHMINGLYKLTHDCGNETLRNLLQIVRRDGKQLLKPFNITEPIEEHELSDAIEFVQDVENMRIVHYHNMKPDSVADQSSVRKAEKKFQDILKCSTGPQSDTEWERCISWIYKKCELIHKLLEERLEFLETKATKDQQNNFRTNYYGCLREYYKRIMFEVIKDVLRKKRRDTRNNIQIKALVSKYNDDISDKAVSLIENSANRVEPYLAVCQAADMILTNNRQI